MTLERRLAALESLLGVEPGVRARTPQERAVAAIVDGTAMLSDFERYFEPAMPVVRAAIVVRARFFHDAREKGREICVWWPLDRGAAITALPLAVDPDSGLVDPLVEMTRLRVPRPGRTTSLRPAQREVALALWRQASIALVALGAPDGRPLRHAVAEGHFDDATEVVRAAGLRLLSADALARRY